VTLPPFRAAVTAAASPAAPAPITSMEFVSMLLK